MASFLIPNEGRFGVTPGQPGDRGCVSCGWIAAQNGERQADIYIVDKRERYWCIDCAQGALANITRRNEDRDAGGILDTYRYRWSFGDLFTQDERRALIEVLRSQTLARTAHLALAEAVMGPPSKPEHWAPKTVFPRKSVHTRKP